MPSYEDTVITRFVADFSQFNSELNKASSQGTALARMQNMGILDQKGIDKTVSQLNLQEEQVRALTDSYTQMNSKLKESRTRFDMNILSWVFGGMALQRMGLQMTRFLIPSMDKLEKLNTAGAKKVMHLAAAFEFLKISLFETLANTPLFEQFVAWLIKAAIWISEFTQKHPLLVEMVAVIGGLAAILGTLAIGVGIFGQLGHLGTLLGIGGGAGGGILKAVNSLGIALLALTLPEALLLSVAALGLAAVLAALYFEETRAKMKELWDLGFKESGQQIFDAIGRILDMNLQWEDALKYLASLGVWVFSLLSFSIKSLSSPILLVLDVIDLLKAEFQSTYYAAKALLDLLSFDFDEAGQNFAKSWELSTTSLKENLKQIYDDQKAVIGDLGTISGEITKGPTGIFREAFSGAEEFNTSIEQNQSLITEGLNPAYQDFFDKSLSKLGNPGEDGTLANAWTMIGEDVLQNQAFLDAYKSAYDDWAPQDKHSTHYIHEEIVGSEGSYSSSKSRRSSVTTA